MRPSAMSAAAPMRATFTFAPGTLAPGDPTKEVKDLWGEVLIRSGNDWTTEQLIHTRDASPSAQPQSQAKAR